MDGNHDQGVGRMESPVKVACQLFATAAIAMAAPLYVAAHQIEAREAALKVFVERVGSYAALHVRLERALPPLDVTRETLRLFAIRQRLADGIREARAGARQGDIFSPDVADVFRAIIAERLAGRDVEGFLIALHEEHPSMHGVRPTVNGPFISGASQEMPTVLLHALPALPTDVEYRIVNHDLVLWDIHANLVIDFVPDALGGRGTVR